MAQKNKETQTQKMPNECPSMYPLAYGMMPNHLVCQYYMNKEEELYRQACRLKGIPFSSVLVAVDEDDGEDEVEEEEEEEEGPNKVIYRYTLEEMKRFNPYRYCY